jgi:transitional endoplasmic reticulum ATPase
LILPHNVKSEIYSKVRLFERGELLIRGILLYGPPGTGKTLVARTIADTINARFMPVSLSDLKRGSAGTTAQAVRDLFSHARDAHQAVIFVDECDAVFTTRDSLASEKSLDELVSSFLALWDGINKSQAILVIGATNRRERIDPAIQSRFSVIQEIPLPDEASRAAILKVEAKKLGIDAEVASQFSRNAEGFSGRDIENLVLTVASEVKTGKSVEQAFREGLGTYRQRGSDKIANTELLVDLVLPTTIQEEIRILIEYISNPDKLKAKGFAIPKAALLYGPSGTGKSTIVRSIIKSTGLPFIAPTTSELRGTAEGQTGKIIRELFQRARSTAPCVLCLEDLDAIAPRRGGSVTPGNLSAEAVGQLIQELEAAATGDARIFVLAVTDRPQDVDEAVLSRFPKRTQIAAPDLGSRAALFRKFIGARACAIEPERLIAKLAAVTEGKTARDIRNIVQDAEHRALARSLGGNGGGELALDLEDFLRAVHESSLTSGAAQ